MVRKANFLSITVHVSEIVNFMSIKKSSLWISPKMLKNNRKAEFSSMWLTLWRITVFVNIYPLSLVWLKNSCLNKSKISSGFAPFKHGKKTIFLTISMLITEIVTFMSKKKSSLRISPKMLQNNRKALFSSMWLTSCRKTVFVNIFPLLMVWSKTVV